MIKFTKMHGLGNDYIYIEKEKNNIPDDKIPEFTRFVSDRHFGIGGDGAIFIEKSKIADFKMSIYNLDGSQAEMCGNGIRCFAKYVYDNGLIDKEVIEIETLAGIKNAFLTIHNGKVIEVRVCMGEPVFDLKKLQEINFINKEAKQDIVVTSADKEFKVTPVSMGNPHAIIFVEDVENFDVEKYGQFIEFDKTFPSRTNVEFVQVINDSQIKMRVWERGSGETYACGTGACATAVACYLQGLTQRNVTISLKGGDLKISWNEENNKIYMTGPATKVFDGEIDYEF